LARIKNCSEIFKQRILRREKDKGTAIYKLHVFYNSVTDSSGHAYSA
jgi:hypothetical protein